MFNFLNRKSNKKSKDLHRNNNNIYISNEIATRDRVDFTSLLGYLPDPDEILLNTGNTFDVYRKLMVDSQIRACSNSRKAGTKSLLWDIDKGKENKSKYTKIIKDFYERDLDIDSMNDAILNAPLFGFQPIEIIWGRIGEYILPIELKPKNPEWFMFGPKGELKLLTPGNFLTGEDLPQRKFLTPTYNDINNNYYNPYGDRLLSSCFWPATFKKSGYKWWVTFTEKYGMPYIIGKLPAGQDQERQGMLDNLKAMAMDAVAVISDDASVEVTGITGSSNNAELYRTLIESCDAAIAKTLLGQTLTTEGSDKGVGSQALGRVHSGIRDDIILSDKKLVENTHNKLIRWIAEINFGIDTDLPKFEMFEEEDVDLDLAQRDKILKDTGVKFTKSYIMRTYGFEEDDIEEVESVPESKDGFKPEEPNSEDKLKEDKESEFAEKGEYYTDQIIKQFSDIQLQSQIKEALSPVFKLINSANEYNEVLKALDGLNPTMSTVDIEKHLTKVLFIAELLGSKDARDEVIK